MTRIDNQRVIRAPHGTDLSAKSWLTEAPLRMLMNNLDPGVAEKPVSSSFMAVLAGLPVTGKALTASSLLSVSSKMTRRCSCNPGNLLAYSRRTLMHRAC